VPEVFRWIPQYPINEQVVFRTLISQTEHGLEQRRSKWLRPRRRFGIRFNALPKQDFDAIWDFFIARRGSYEPFYFRNLHDDPVEDEVVGTGDGTTTTFSFANRYVVPETDRVYLDGVLQVRDADYTIDTDAGRITFATAPAQGVTITASYEFYRKVRFDIDNLQREQFAFLLFRAELPMMEVLE